MNLKPDEAAEAPAEAPAENTVRSALEAAVAEVEKSEDTSTSSPAPSASAPTKVTSPAPSPKSGPEDDEEEDQDEAGRKESVQAEKAPTAPAPVEDVAPKAWKAATRAKWSTLDPEVKAEVRRRESEMTRAYGEHAQARELQKGFNEMIRPFEARIRAAGANPVQLVGELFKADYLLSTSPPRQKAQYMAKLINDYGVDWKELDAALTGSAPADPMAAAIEQALAKQLTPLQQFVAQQQQQEQFREQTVQQQAVSEVEAMASDPKYPHLAEVREDMADLIDLFAKRGVYLTLADAYTRAVAMNPELAAQAASQQQAESQRQQALKQNGRAQRALNASSSVSSSPSGTPKPGSSAPSSVRSTIEAAFDEIIGR